MFGGNHVHAARETAGSDVAAKRTGLVEGGAVAQRRGSCLPAAAMGAAIKLADGVNELMTGVLLPVRRFPAAGNDNAGAQALDARRTWNRGGQMHKKSDGTNYAVRIMHQAD